MYKSGFLQNSLSDNLLNIGKIAIIVFFSVVIVTNFVPFFENVPNSYLHGIQTMRLLDGTWTVTNEFLEETGSWEFVPGGWKKTIHDSAIPKHSPGLAGIGTFFYLTTGLYGLFYLGPIFTIALLITSERIATKLFGKYVGFFTLLFLATNGYIFTVGQHLLTDNIFAMVTMIGFFFLIKFIFEKKYSYLLIASLILSCSSFVRGNGIYYLPIEGLIVSLYVILRTKKCRGLLLRFDKEEIFQNIKNISKADIGKILLFVVGPWMIYIVFFLSFNNYYFGDPTTTYYTIPGDPWIRTGTGSVFSIFEMKSEYGETMKAFSNYALPYPIYRIEHLDFETIINERDDPFTSTSLIAFQGLVGQNSLGLLTFAILILALIVSFYTKSYRIVTSIFCITIFSITFFWTANQIAYGSSPVITGRYMLPTFPFMSIILGFLITKILRNKKLQKRDIKLQSVSKILKIIFILIIIFFFIIALYNAAPTQLIKNNEFKFNNPTEHISYYPLDLEGFDESTILVGGDGDRTVDYGFIPFFPYIGQDFMVAGFISENTNQNSINNLKKLVEEEKDVIMFKEARRGDVTLFRQELVSKYGFILEDHTKTFCKIKFTEGIELAKAIQLTDDICYGNK